MAAARSYVVRQASSAWGFLERLGGRPDEEIYLLHDAVVSIGRSETSVVRISSGKVSRNHCEIHFDTRGHAHLDDKSSNGTWINNKILVKNDSCDLRTGDEVVLARGDESKGKVTIGFKFRLLFDVDIFSVMPDTLKRSLDQGESSTGVPNPKRRRGEVVIDSDDDEVMVEREVRPITQQSGVPGPVDVVTIDDDEFAEPTESFESRLRKKIKEEQRLSSASASSTPSRAAEESGTGPLATYAPYLAILSREEREKRLVSVLTTVSDLVTCCICMEYAHDPVTSTGCLHSFCGSCLSKWLFTDDASAGIRQNCPKCRRQISQVTRNAGLASVVTDLTTLKPEDERRTAEEIVALDSDNKFNATNTNTFDVSRMRSEGTRAAAAARIAAVGLALGRGTRGGRRNARRNNSVVNDINFDVTSPIVPVVQPSRVGRGRRSVNAPRRGGGGGGVGLRGGGAGIDDAGMIARLDSLMQFMGSFY